MNVTLRWLVFGYSLFARLSAHEQQFPLCSAYCFLPAFESSAGPTGAVAIAAVVSRPMQGLTGG